MAGAITATVSAALLNANPSAWTKTVFLNIVISCLVSAIPVKQPIVVFVCESLLPAYFLLSLST